MKKLLIISPYFPPSNAADSHRIRLSLPYFHQNGWQPTIVAVKDTYSDMVKDELLVKSIPANISVHRVGALSKKWTRKIGLGSIALRSLWYYRQYLNRLLKEETYDLLYFSTTQFPVLILGPYLKRKFNLPYVIDMQDPWHSEYYQSKSKKQRPAKYWFSYRLNKFLEPIGMSSVGGFISVSASYIENLKTRYPSIKALPSRILPFSADRKDFEIAFKYKSKLSLNFDPNDGLIHLVYVGRASIDMEPALKLLFKAFKLGLKTNHKHFDRIRFHFIGTSYAEAGLGQKSIEPISKEFGLDKYIREQTNRISYYNTINHLLHAHALIVLGSDDPNYTASKIFAYIIANRPLLAIFNKSSSVKEILRKCDAKLFVDIEDTSQSENIIYNFLSNIDTRNATSLNALRPLPDEYTAENMTKKQCELFDQLFNSLPK